MGKRSNPPDPTQLGSPLDEAVAQRDLSTVDMVKKALAHNEVVLAFQPVVSATNPKRAVFHEALLRVLDATGRVIPAKDFMPEIKNTSLARDLDCLALNHALTTLKRNPKVMLSVNMSARSIGVRKWRKILDLALSKNPEVAKRLILEISETSALNLPEVVGDFMDQMQAKGVSFALDDFGADLTSFTQFKSLYFDILKLDKHFATRVASESDNQILARSIALLAKEFAMLSVATKVERADDAKMLASLGVDCLQGYALAPPTISPPWLNKQSSKRVA